MSEAINGWYKFVNELASMNVWYCNIIAVILGFAPIILALQIIWLPFRVESIKTDMNAIRKLLEQQIKENKNE